MEQPLKDFEILTFRIHSLLYWFVWPIPWKWNKDYTKLEWKGISWKSVPLLVSLLVVFLYGVSCYVILLLQHQVAGYANIDINSLSLALTVIGGSICLMFTFGVAVLGRNSRLMIQNINDQLELALDLQNGNFFSIRLTP